jgi:tetratricopeptide (TPR) repeat protein
MLAGRLRHHPAWPLRYLAQRVTSAVTSTRDRLGEFRAENVAVAAAFEVSYHGLPAATQRLFRRLSLHTGPDIDAYAATALDGRDLLSVVHRLERLYDDHLLIEYSPGRYRLHDLLRIYAAELAALDDRAENATARRRLLDYYRWTTASATAHLPVFLEHSTSLTPVPPPAHAPTLHDRAVALEWLDAEHANLVGYATRYDVPEMAAVAVELHPYLRLRGQFGQAQSLYRDVLTAMDAVGARCAHLLIRLAVMQRLAGDYTAARENVRQAHILFTDFGDVSGQAIALYELGYLARLVLDVEAAHDALDRAYRLFTELDDSRGQASALMQLGVMQRIVEDFDAARETLTRACDLFTNIGDRFGQATTLKDLGILQRYTDDYQAARDNLARAYDLAVSIGDSHGQGNALLVLGWVHRLLGDYDAARGAVTRAHGITIDIGDLLGQANTLNELGVLHWVVGDYDAARDAFSRAYETYMDIGNPFGQADALRNLGSVEGATGDPRRALEMINYSYEQFTANNDRVGQAETLCELGALQDITGDHDSARRALTRAREMFVESGSRSGEACALNRLGAVELRQDHIDEAFDHHCHALALAEEIHLPAEQARAHEGIGDCHSIRGNHAEARAHHGRAKEIYRRLGVPDRADVRPGPQDHGK